MFLQTIADSLVLGAGWSIDNLETNVRNIISIILLLIVGFQAIKAYGRGQKGKAIVEIVFGVVIAIVVADKATLQALGKEISRILGFS